MVYEQIGVMTCHHSLNKPITPGESKHTSRSRLVVCTGILATCHQIHNEAQPIFAKKFDCIHSQPVRFHVDVASALDLVWKKSPLVACFGIKTPSFVNGRYTLTRIPEQLRTPNIHGKLILKDTAEGCNVTEFVHGSLAALTRAKTTPLTPARPYDVEVILTQDVMSWNPQTFCTFLHNLNRVLVQARVAVVVKSKIPKMEVQPELVKDWKFWQLIYNDVIKMPSRSKMRLEDIGEGVDMAF